jgi:predicted nucleic acid-binding protein
VILVDTSIWVDHLRSGDDRLREILERGEVLVHPAVIGELACGNLARRAEILPWLQALPRAVAASDDEALAAVEMHRLHGHGLGLGWIDVHLLASALLTRCPLLTRDAALAAAAARLGVGA